METGNPFQAFGPATLKARSPNFSLVRFTANEKLAPDGMLGVRRVGLVIWTRDLKVQCYNPNRASLPPRNFLGQKFT